MSTPAAVSIPPPSQNEINLSIADIVIQAVLFLVTVFVSWKHGKYGMVCWPILVTYFPLRILADSWQVMHRDEPDIPNAVYLFTTAGCITILSLGLIGAVYEAAIVFPPSTKKASWVDKGLLGVTHLFNTAGIAIATYGGSPDAETGGVMSAPLAQAGNCLMIACLLITCAWLFSTHKRISRSGAANSAAIKSRKNSQTLLFTSAAGIPFQLVRLGYSTVYAFTRVPSLDPYMGSFTTKFVFIFLIELIVTVILVVGGCLSRNAAAPGDKSRSSVDFQEERELVPSRSPSDASDLCPVSVSVTAGTSYR